MACLLKNEPASYALWPSRLSNERLWSRSESESEEGDKVGGSRPETT